MLYPLYTVGYTSITDTIFYAAMLNFIASQGGDEGKLIDTRYSAWSRNPSYTSYTFKKNLGAGYVNMGDKFGNLNYKEPEKGIALADPGYYTVLVEMLKHAPQILMCGCKDSAHCHRSHVAQLVMDAHPTKATVIHLTITDIVRWSDRTQPALQPVSPAAAISKPIQQSLI